MISTALGRILTAAVEETPGAVSGSLAAGDGETVDAVTTEPGDHALVTAHFAIVMSQVRSALGVFHYGGVSELVIKNRRLTVLVRPVDDDYLAVLTIAPWAQLAIAQRALGRATEALRAEIA